MHLNAFFNLKTNFYTDAVIQPVHRKNEFRAFCDMVGRYETRPERKAIFIGAVDTVPIIIWPMS